MLAAAALPAGPVWAQAGIDLDDGTHPAAAPPPPAPSLPALDMPTANGADNHAGIVDGIRTMPNGNDPGGDKLIPQNNTVTTTQSPQGGTSPAAQPAASLPPPVDLENPKVVSTAQLSGNGKTVPLFGIVGLEGEAAQQLEAYLTGANGHLICPAQTTTDYVCTTPDGTDVAVIALANGAAKARDDAPDAYKAQEAAARESRKGIWADLPPPPDAVVHPTVTNTATLVSGDKKFILDGVIGLGQPYAAQLQGYIQANGDRLTCQPQGVPGHYICMLDNGTDIAKIALVNGAARVGPDAPDTYRLEQLNALNNHRGFWLNPPANYAANDAPPSPDGCCTFVAGDDGGDGVYYVGGEPTAVIDGQTVFLILAGAAGWGYYDRDHHWHDAPGNYRSHLERFHPNGQGLRAYRPLTVGGGVRPPVGVGVGVGLHVGGGVVTGGHVGVGVGGVPLGGDTGVAFGGGHPVGPGPGFRPGVPFGGGGGRPGPTFATHSSVGGGGFHGFGGGFVRPTAPTGGGFHGGAPHVVTTGPIRHR
jgi:endonuclease YncB( thermonuclease family)